MKILVLSDSHRTQTHMHQAVRRERPDQILHLGDHLHDAQRLQTEFPEISVFAVPGNCDVLEAGGNPIAIREFAGVRVFLTHGHVHGVKQGLLRLELAAREAAAQVVVFGHTHQALCAQKEGLWMLNPGSCMAGSHPSYGVILVENGKIICYTVTNLHESETQTCY